jgi:hypothetical protein
VPYAAGASVELSQLGAAVARRDLVPAGSANESPEPAVLLGITDRAAAPALSSARLELAAAPESVDEAEPVLPPGTAAWRDSAPSLADLEDDLVDVLGLAALLKAPLQA